MYETVLRPLIQEKKKYIQNKNIMALKVTTYGLEEILRLQLSVLLSFSLSIAKFEKNWTLVRLPFRIGVTFVIH